MPLTSSRAPTATCCILNDTRSRQWRHADNMACAAAPVAQSNKSAKPDKAQPGKTAASNSQPAQSPAENKPAAATASKDKKVSDVEPQTKKAAEKASSAKHAENPKAAAVQGDEASTQWVCTVR